jgi:monomeric sarcosine oxidase
MRDRCQIAVIGAGGLGSAAAYWLSRTAGEGVVCLEQYEPGHELGASEDHSRIIRLAYHAERYTALAKLAYEAWDVVEDESGVPLVHRTGSLDIARPGTDGGAILEAFARAMSTHDVAFERLDAAELMRRFPQFTIDEDYQALHQADGGILDIRRACAVHLALARAHGATVVPHAGVHMVRATDEGVEIQTAAGTIEAERAVICAGAWTPGLLHSLGVELPIRLTHEQVTYFATTQLARFAPERFPIWLWHGDHEYYGFPVYGEVGTKAARENLDGPQVDMAAWDRVPDAAQEADVTRFCESILPGFTGPVLRTRACVYDMPPDRDFILDQVPGHPRLTMALGAGHAAKFACVIGRILSELVLTGETRDPVEPFRIDRPAITDPDYTVAYRLGGEAIAAA